jgi:hypothetical protein
MMYMDRSVPVLVLLFMMSTSVTGGMKLSFSQSEQGSSTDGQASVEARAIPQDGKAGSAKQTMSNSIGMELVYVEPGEFLIGPLYCDEIAAK